MDLTRPAQKWTFCSQSYHDFRRLVQRAGGDEVLFIKDNTPVSRADLNLFSEDAQADRWTWRLFETIEKGHGRLERCHIITSPDRNRVSQPELDKKTLIFYAWD